MSKIAASYLPHLYLTHALGVRYPFGISILQALALVIHYPDITGVNPLNSRNVYSIVQARTLVSKKVYKS